MLLNIISLTMNPGSCSFWTNFYRTIYHIGPRSKGLTLELIFVCLPCLSSQTTLTHSWLRTSAGNAILVRKWIFFKKKCYSKYLPPHHRWHCHMYPNCIELSDDLVCELRASLMHFASGIILPRNHPKAPYSDFCFRLHIIVLCYITVYFGKPWETPRLHG